MRSGIGRGSSRQPDAVSALALLARTSATLGTAESLTGGRLAALVTAVPGASVTYLGGVVAYASHLKESLLGVPAGLVERYGVVSAECAEAMAVGCRALTGSTYALSTTGVAGPDEQEGKPVGTVFVGLAGPDRVQVLVLELAGDRGRIQELTCREALSALCETLRGRMDREQPPLR